MDEKIDLEMRNTDLFFETYEELMAYKKKISENLTLDLKYDEKFKQFLMFRDPNHLFGGVQYAFKFENNYGLSVIKFDGTIGYQADCWEVMLLKWTGNEYRLLSEPIGWLDDDVVNSLLDMIQQGNLSVFENE